MKISDLLLPKVGREIQIEGKSYIRIAGESWKNAELQIVHVDVVMDAKGVPAGTGEFREIKAFVRVVEDK